MHITLDKISKRFTREWILRECSMELVSGQSYAITGPNGSGKSSLAQIIAAYLTPNKGSIEYRVDQQVIETANVYKYLAYAAPYVELIEEFTLEEQLRFHFNLKQPDNDLSIDDILELMGLQKARNKEIRHFSSGMKQRAKIGMALCTMARLVILDEPTTNLDSKGVTWYHEMIERFATNKILVICSNQEREYEFCEETFDLMQWK